MCYMRAKVEVSIVVFVTTSRGSKYAITTANTNSGCIGFVQVNKRFASALLNQYEEHIWSTQNNCIRDYASSQLMKLSLQEDRRQNVRLMWYYKSK